MQDSVTKIRIGIIRGGANKHYSFSLKKGADIIEHILENFSHKYKIVDILVDKNDNWYINGIPIKPADLMHKVDIVWNTSSHYDLSTILNNLSIPHIGASSFSSILESNNDIFRKHLKNIGIEMPRSIILPFYQKDFDGDKDKYIIKKAKEIHEKFGAPWIIKSFTPDSSMGIHLAKTFPELVEAIEDGVNHKKSILVEEFIAGKIASVHSLSGFREHDVYTFPLGNSFENFSFEEKEKLFNLTKKLHILLESKHYLKSDLVLNPKGRVYLLGIEFHPNLKANSHLDQVSELVGIKTHEIFEHILEKALKR